MKPQKIVENRISAHFGHKVVGFCQVVKLSSFVFHLKATGARLAIILQDTASVGTCIIIGFIYSWRFTLGILAFIPLLLGAGFLQMKMLGGMAKQGHAALEDASKVIQLLVY